ncbi:glycosyltransferase family 2 protein [Vibrio metschnikovii]|uniref:Glycosyltransferase family 2 protein n=1 Tax=Vibrio metschnikovii TaxID=28172 RepID=A0A9X0R9G5_VIBME|nr:glycosyltransferase family 2 protein [Vibrio metschnikovii]MBC5851952.1 glycosyltransferase family 2 protein [Vibrio metschnikovii]
MTESQLSLSTTESAHADIDLLMPGPLMSQGDYWLDLHIRDPWQYQGVVIEYLDNDLQHQKLPLGMSLQGRVRQWVWLPKGASAIAVRDSNQGSNLTVRLTKQTVRRASSWYAGAHRLIALLAVMRRDDVLNKPVLLGQLWRCWREAGILAAYQRLQRCKVRSAELPLASWWQEHLSLRTPQLANLQRRLSHNLQSKVVIWIYPRAGMQQDDFLATLASCCQQGVEIYIDARIPFTVPQGIAASVSAYQALQQDSVWQSSLLLPVGAKLLPHAAACFFQASLNQPQAEVIYADHAVLDSDANHASAPSQLYLKPDWCLERQRAEHYCGDVLLVRNTVLQRVDSRWTESDSAHPAYDFLLSIAETSAAKTFYHLRLPLWLQTYAAELPLLCKSLTQHLARCGVLAQCLPYEGRVAEIRYQTVWQPKVSVLIPLRDNLAVTQQCVDSVLSLTDYADYEIVLIDNQSQQPETLAWLASIAKHPQVTLLHYDAPFNFSAINNVAAQQAKGEVLVLLNNDTQVIEAQWLSAMLAGLALPNVGIVGAQLLFANGLIQHAGCVVGPQQVATHRLAFSSPSMAAQKGEGQSLQEVSAVTAACLMIRKSLYQALNGLDEQLTVAFNDVDLCLRVREQGLRVLYSPFARLYHYESLSRGKDTTPEKKQRAAQEVEYMHQRWSIRSYQDPFYHPLLDSRLANFQLNPFPQGVSDCNPL